MVRLRHRQQGGRAPQARAADEGARGHRDQPSGDRGHARRAETVAEFARSYIEQRKLEGVKNWQNEDRWLRLYVLPAIGTMALTEVRAPHVREVLEGARARGRGKQSLIHIRGVMSRLFATPWRDELIAENPVARVEVPRVNEVNRPRVILSDGEFVQLVACEAVDLEHRVMAVAARVVGGMRTGVHAWSSEDIDQQDFARWLVPRVKTGQPQALVLPETGRVVLRAWWALGGQPTKGPVFPARRGKRAGQRKLKARDAQRLRKAFLLAGVDRPEVHTIARPPSADFHVSGGPSRRPRRCRRQRPARVAARWSRKLDAHHRYLMQSAAMQTSPGARRPSF